MAKKSGGVNKSNAIRTYKGSHSDAGPKEIAEALGKDGIKVTPAFVSTVLSNDKRKGGKGGNGRRKRRGGRRPGRPGGNKTMATLMQAKKLADQMGGVDRARRALNALSRLLR